jgi:hypothetical protein
MYEAFQRDDSSLDYPAEDIVFSIRYKAGLMYRGIPVESHPGIPIDIDYNSMWNHSIDAIVEEAESKWKIYCSLAKGNPLHDQLSDLHQSLADLLNTLNAKEDHQDEGQDTSLHPMSISVASKAQRCREAGKYFDDEDQEFLQTACKRKQGIFEAGAVAAENLLSTVDSLACRHQKMPEITAVEENRLEEIAQEILQIVRDTQSELDAEENQEV